MNISLNRLPDAELLVMQAVWDCTPPVSRADVERVLEDRHPLASTTFLTLLTRLTQRGALTLAKQGRTNVYTPVFSRQDYLASQSRRFLNKLCGGNIHVLASALCDSGLSREEVAELRRLLDEDER